VCMNYHLFAPSVGRAHFGAMKELTKDLFK
jgi:hypothetical protein